MLIGYILPGCTQIYQRILQNFKRWFETTREISNTATMMPEWDFAV